MRAHCPRACRADKRLLERHPLASEVDLARPGSVELLRPREHRFELLVRMERVVVEQHKPPGAGPPRERHRILGARMSPADPLVILVLRVLSIVE